MFDKNSQIVFLWGITPSKKLILIHKLLCFFFRKTSFVLDQQQVAFVGKYSTHWSHFHQPVSCFLLPVFKSASGWVLCDSSSYDNVKFCDLCYVKVSWEISSLFLFFSTIIFSTSDYSKPPLLPFVSLCNIACSKNTHLPCWKVQSYSWCLH